MTLRELLKRHQFADLLNALDGVAGDAKAAPAERVLVLGTNERDALSLLEGLGIAGPLGERALNCPVICGYAEAFSAEIEAGEVRKSCPDRMSLTVHLRDMKPDCVRLFAPSPLLHGREIAFLTLSERGVEADMMRWAVGCRAAFAAISATVPPSGALFAALNWLREVRGLKADAFAVLFCHCEEAAIPNRAALSPIKLALEAEQEPRCFDVYSRPGAPAAKSPGQALELALSGACGGKAQTQDAGAVERKLAKTARQRLCRELEELDGARPKLPKAPGTSLADSFRASARLQRYRLDDIIPQETADLFAEELTGFALFFRGNMRELLGSALELDAPKDALQAFGVSYVSQVFSDFSDRLARALLEQKIAPVINDALNTALRDSFIELEQEQPRFEYEGESQQIIGGVWELPQKELLQLILRIGISHFFPWLHLVSGMLAKWLYQFVSDITVKAMPNAEFVKATSARLEKLCDDTVSEYRKLFYDNILPNLKDSLKRWYDGQVADIADRLRQMDERADAEYAQAMDALREWTQKCEALEASIRELAVIAGEA